MEEDKINSDIDLYFYIQFFVVHTLIDTHVYILRIQLSLEFGYFNYKLISSIQKIKI